MRSQKLPKGWTPEMIRGAINHYENQTGEEAVAEMEDAFANGRGYRTMSVPVEVEDQVLRIIASAEETRRHPAPTSPIRIAETKKSYNK